MTREKLENLIKEITGLGTFSPELIRINIAIGQYTKYLELVNEVDHML